MNSQQAKLRIACVQLDPKHGDKAATLVSAKRLLSDLILHKEQRPVDLVVLPELALTGYVFRDYAHIEPLLESPSSLDGLGLAYASELAQTLSCYVAMGFAESVPHQTIPSANPAKSAARIRYDARPSDIRDQGPSPLSFPAHNSAALFGPNGELIHTFRKHFLFDDDKRWASEGAGFEAITLPGFGNVCIAICMDLNPFEFKTSFESCELATFCAEHEVDYLILPMAWLLPKDELIGGTTAVKQPSISTINYWALRCQPFFNATAGLRPGAPKYLITANRTGTEGSSTFAGSSCVLQMKQAERPVLLDALGTREEGILLVEIPAGANATI